MPIDGYFFPLMPISSFEPGRRFFLSNEEHAGCGNTVEQEKIVVQDNNYQLINWIYFFRMSPFIRCDLQLISVARPLLII